MKKIIIALIALSTMYAAGSITPMLGMRFNNIASASATPTPVTAVGLKIELNDGVYTGFDTNVTGDPDFRIFLERSFGKVGLVSNAAGEPTFTIGALYGIYSNLNVEVEYMVNKMVKTPEVETDKLRLSLTVQF